MNTEPNKSQTLRLGIKRLRGNNTQNVPAQPDLYKAQSSLGFMSLFDGIIHQDWAEQQEDHLHGKKLWAPQSTRTQWSVQVIKFLWEKFLELWGTQNKEVHGSDEQARNALKADRKSCITTKIGCWQQINNTCFNY
eukprot:4436822-Ditylum_brightwellii.AAC.1